MSKFEQYLLEKKPTKPITDIKYGTPNTTRCSGCGGLTYGGGGTYDKREWCDDCLEEIEISLTEENTKYKGTYNWHKENHVLYTSASSEASANRNMISQLAKKLNRTMGSVSLYFKNTPNSYKIEKA